MQDEKSNSVIARAHTQLLAGTSHRRRTLHEARGCKTFSRWCLSLCVGRETSGKPKKRVLHSQSSSVEGHRALVKGLAGLFVGGLLSHAVAGQHAAGTRAGAPWAACRAASSARVSAAGAESGPAQ
ncbi:hypothetical protein MRX96_030857 [Rhipicephalus microplus]